MEVSKQGVPQGSILGPLFFLLCLSDLPKTVSNISKPVLFADGTSIIVTNHSPTDFTNDINKVIGNINDWFIINFISLNSDKTLFTILD